MFTVGTFGSFCFCFHRPGQLFIRIHTYRPVHEPQHNSGHYAKSDRQVLKNRAAAFLRTPCAELTTTNISWDAHRVCDAILKIGHATKKNIFRMLCLYGPQFICKPTSTTHLDFISNKFAVSCN